MKKILLLALLCLPACVTSVTTTGSTATPGKQTEFVYPHIKRPNLLVADLDRSLEIYRDILGFESAPISESGLDSYSYPVFNIPREARMRYTYLGESNEDRVLGLTEVTNVDLPRPVSSPYMNTVVIGVSGLSEKLERLAALGLEMTEPKTAGGAEFTFTEVAFVDPDGHMIVLYEVVG